MKSRQLSLVGMCGRVAATLVLPMMLAMVSPALAAEGEHEGGGAPPPVDTSTNPEAIALNAKNPLAIHAGPGKPNVGSIYLAPSLSGKDKGKKSGQTEEKVMGGAPEH